MPDITVILNRYRRPHYYEEQVKAIENQTIKPKEIWVWDNGHEDSAAVEYYCDPSGEHTLVTKAVTSTHNFKYHGRFALGLLARTKFVAFFDDDTIPGSKWFENCLNCYKEKPGIYGGVGVRLYSKNYMDHDRTGWPGTNVEIEEADLVGHAWFMSRRDLCYLWQDVPISLDNAEDIQLSYFAQKFGGVKTYCPPHPTSDLAMWSSLKPFLYGVDNVASSNNTIKPFGEFVSERDYVVAKCLEGGWKTVYNVKI
jgi:glycosyltransferase involved in cell wall biosynthesis